eukprot:Rmarinus@m.25891
MRHLKNNSSASDHYDAQGMNAGADHDETVRLRSTDPIYSEETDLRLHGTNVLPTNPGHGTHIMSQVVFEPGRPRPVSARVTSREGESFQRPATARAGSHRPMSGRVKISRPATARPAASRAPPNPLYHTNTPEATGLAGSLPDHRPTPPHISPHSLPPRQPGRPVWSAGSSGSVPQTRSHRVHRFSPWKHMDYPPPITHNFERPFPPGPGGQPGGRPHTAGGAMYGSLSRPSAPGGTECHHSSTTHNAQRRAQSAHVIGRSGRTGSLESRHETAPMGGRGPGEGGEA